MAAWQGYTTAAPSLVHRACAQGPDPDVRGCSASAHPNPSTTPACHEHTLTQDVPKPCHQY